MSDSTEEPGLVSSILNSLGPSEAYGFPIGKALKAASKKGLASIAAKPFESRAEEILVGTAFQGKTITQVTKGVSNWRNIHLDDDTIVPVTRDVLADMARSAGTKQYTEKLPEQGGVSQLYQAIRSLDYHLKRVQPAQTPNLMKHHWNRYRDQLKEAGSYIPSLTMVQYKGKLMNIPTEYADILEKEKVVKDFKVIMRLK